MFWVCICDQRRDVLGVGRFLLCVWFSVRLIISGFEFSSLRCVCVCFMLNLIFQYLNFHLWDMCGLLLD